MSMRITDDCVSCNACEPECPREAIRDGDPHVVIDPALCTECAEEEEGSRCVAVCPVDCIVKAE